MAFKPKSVQDLPKEVVEEGRVHYTDGDMLSFVIAAASEKKIVTATHIPSGTSKEFKNKTEFQGRSKKTVGGWLGNLNKKREDEGKPIFDLKEFELETTYTPDSIENCLHSIKRKIENIETHLDQKTSHIVMGKGDNFRHELPLPTRYKANREGLHKPLLLDKAREYLINIKKAEVCVGIEADDRLAHYQYQGHKGFIETGEHTTIVSAVDKDARQTDGLLFNPTTSTGSKFIYPDPLVINGLGELYLNPKGEPKGHGRAWLYYQILFGDPTDGYSPTNGFIKGFGEKSAFNILVDCQTDKEYWEKLVEVYHDWFPTGLQYKSHCGQDMDITPVEWMQMQATCAFMQRWEDDYLDVAKVLTTLGITYD